MFLRGTSFLIPKELQVHESMFLPTLASVEEVLDALSGVWKYRDYNLTAVHTVHRGLFGCRVWRTA